MADSVAETRSVKMTRAEWRAWEWKLYKGYGLFTLFLLAFIAIIMFLELNAGLPRGLIAMLFIVLSFAL
jgi:hypothetical protein